MWILANTFDFCKQVQDGTVVFKISDISSAWFKENIGKKSYVQVKYHDGTYQILDMNYNMFQELVEAIDEAELD